MQYEDQLTGSAAPSNLQFSLAELQEARELRRLRISAVLLLAIALAALIWALPWARIGMTAGDLDRATLIEIALLLALWLGTAAAVLRWAPLLTGEPRSELLRALMGERLSIRGQKRFLRRLHYQCEQGLRGRTRSFSLVVLALPSLDRSVPDGEGLMNRVLHEVRRVIRSSDVLGDSEREEVWVLLADAAAQASDSVCARLAASLREVIEPAGAEAHLGWSTFEVDGRDAATLFRVARQRRSPLADRRVDDAAA